MKDLHKKVAKLSECLALDAELKAELKPIIKDTYDYHCNGIVGYEFLDDGETIRCYYSYRCRGESDTDFCEIPLRWLEDGYDYRVDYEEMKRKSEEERKRMEEEVKKREHERKKKSEYETYLKLKKKYEQNSTKGEHDGSK